MSSSLVAGQGASSSLEANSNVQYIVSLYQWLYIIRSILSERTAVSLDYCTPSPTRPIVHLLRACKYRQPRPHLQHFRLRAPANVTTSHVPHVRCSTLLLVKFRTASESQMISTWKTPNLHVTISYSSRGRETFPPKFYSAPPLGFFVPPWGSFRPPVGISKPLRRDLKISTWMFAISHVEIEKFLRWN